MAAEGYTVRVVPRNGGGAVDVTRAQSHVVPAAEFQPPAGFARKSIGDVFSR